MKWRPYQIAPSFISRKCAWANKRKTTSTTGDEPEKPRIVSQLFVVRHIVVLPFFIIFSIFETSFGPVIARLGSILYQQSTPHLLTVFCSFVHFIISTLFGFTRNFFRFIFHLLFFFLYRPAGPEAWLEF